MMVIFHTILVFGTAACAILHGPSNTAVVAGRTTVLICEPSSQATISWYHIPIGANSLNIIDHGDTLQNDSTGVEMKGAIPGQQLLIHDTQPHHAGSYRCTVIWKKSTDQSVTEKASATLTVLDSDPFCAIRNATVKEHDYIEMWCSVNFTGNWTPFMEWQQMEDSSGKHRRSLNVTTIETNHSVTSQLIILAEYTQHPLSYLCKTNFTHRQLNNSASNVPNYNYTWESPAVEVLYGPANISVNPHKDEYHPGDQLTCSATSNPAADYQWKDATTNDKAISSAELVISNVMVQEKPHVFICSARNPATNKVLRKQVQFRVRQKDSVTVVELNGMMIIVVPIIIAIIIITALAVFSYFAYVQRKTNGRPINSEQIQKNEAEAERPYAQMVEVTTINQPTNYTTIHLNPDDSVHDYLDLE